MINLICIVIAYLLGSVSSAIILAKLFNKPDPRASGSGNPGATNALRTGGKSMGIMVLVGDLVKGLLAVLIGRFFGVTGFALGLVALFAVIGHVFPVFFKFQGGKGVATALGAVFGLNFFVGLLTALIWIVVARLSRYASLASIVAAASACILVLIIANASYFVPLLIIAGLIIFRHQANITRLRQGTESKIQF